MVKAHSGKAERVSSKKKELAKSVYDIDWEVLIKNGTVKTLYVSQLDKYMSLLDTQRQNCLKKALVKIRKQKLSRSIFITTRLLLKVKRALLLLVPTDKSLPIQRHPMPVFQVLPDLHPQLQTLVKLMFCPGVEICFSKEGWLL